MPKMAKGVLQTKPYYDYYNKYVCSKELPSDVFLHKGIGSIIGSCPESKITAQPKTGLAVWNLAYP